VNRVTRFCVSKFGEEVPSGGTDGAAEEHLITAVQEKINAYTKFLEDHEFRKACAELRSLWVLGNEYLQDAAPWTAFKTDPEQAAVSIRMGLNLIRLYGHLSAPLIPYTSEKMLKIFDESMDDLFWPESINTDIKHLVPGKKFAPPDLLFSKIEDDQLEDWRTKFGGHTL